MRRITPANPHLALWFEMMGTDAVLSVGQNAEVKVTKSFKRGGGFSGTAINPTYVMMRLTAAFGPVGRGWGYEVLSDEVVIGGAILDASGNVIGHESVQRLRILFWWRDARQLEAVDKPDSESWNSNTRYQFEQYGQTTYVAWRAPKDGRPGRFDTDEEAWKKSLTDAVTKAASHLGIGADIHMGLWDDSKYVATREEAGAEQQQEASAEQAAATATKLINDAEALLQKLADADSLKALQQLRAAIIILRPKLQEKKLNDVDASLVEASKAAFARLTPQKEATTETTAGGA